MSQTSVYLIRHGIAAERGTYADDGDRPLIAKGRQKTELVAKKLRSLELYFDVILSSPLVRAKQTAEILKEAGLGNEVIEFGHLAPMGDFDTWLNWGRSRHQSSPVQSIALVGHQPDLGNWAEKLVWGMAKDSIELKKAGVIGVKFPDTGEIVGNCTLFWLTAPKYLVD